MNAFSQNVTPTRDTTGIVLSTEVARAVAVDLIEGDQAKEEVKVLTDEVDTLKAAVNVRDSLVLLREYQIENYIKLREIETAELRQKDKDIQQLNKDLKQQMHLKNLYGGAAGISAILLLISIFANSL